MSIRTGSDNHYTIEPFSGVWKCIDENFVVASKAIVIVFNANRNRIASTNVDGIRVGNFDQAA